MTEAKYHAAVKELKKQLIRDAVEQTQGSYADAARMLGVHPNYLAPPDSQSGVERDL